MTRKTIGLLSKLAAVDEMQGNFGAQNRSVVNLREDSSTKLTQQFASEVEFPKKSISFEQFLDVDIRCGTIVKAEEFQRAKKPAYKIWADFGDEIGVLQTSAQITIHYKLDELSGKQIAGCINLGEKNIAGFLSQFLLLGFMDKDNAVCLVSPTPGVPNGSKLC